jgi:hypothetical protein
MAKAVAVRDGLILTRRYGVMHAIVETDDNVVM